MASKIWARLGVLAMVAVGVAERAFVLRSRLGQIDSDESVVALIGLRLLKGEPYALYWGQHYGGTIEGIVAAPLLAVTGASVAAVKLVPLAFTTATAVLVWDIGRRLLDRTAGIVAALLFWVGPAYFVLRSLNINIYAGTLCFATLALWVLVRLREDDAPLWLGPALGLAAGLAWWSSPQSLFLLLPAAAAFAPTMVRRWRAVLWGVPFAVLGAAPWLVWSMRNSWVSLEPPATPTHVPYLERVTSVLPQASLSFGLQRAYTETWLLGPVGVAATIGVLAALVVLAVRGRRGCRELAVIVAVFPFAYGLSPLSTVAHPYIPRYLIIVTPVAALVLSAVVTAPRRWGRALGATVVALAALSSAVGLRDFDRLRVSDLALGGALVPTRLGALHELLEAHDADYAYADYWLALRATFELGEDTIVVPVEPTLMRHRAYAAAAARADRPPALVTMTASQGLPLLEARLAELGVDYEVDDRGGFRVYFPDRPVRPGDVEDVL